MIKSEREYAVTKKAVAQFASSREALAATAGEDVGRRAALSSVDAQLGDLRAEIAEWERLRAGGVQEINVANWDDLPRALMRARIAQGLTQQELAERLGLKKQQIQRWEDEDYEHAEFWRVLEVADALGLSLTGNVLIGCGIGFRASASDDNWFVGNLFLSIGALRADGTTSVTPYGFSALYWLSGASNCTVQDAHCYTVTTGSTGDRYGVRLQDNGAFLPSGNIIRNIITDNFRNCVANDGTGIGNFVAECYNFNASVNDPVMGADFVIRMDSATRAPIFRSAPRFANGSASRPIISRESQTNTGIFFNTSEIGFSTNGVERLDIVNTQIAASVPIRLPNYTTAASDALASPQAGWIIFNTTTGTTQTYNGSAWV